MSKVKFRLITLLSIFLLLALALGLAFGMLPPKGALSASAESYAPTAIFASGAEGKGDVKALKENAESDAYTTFVMADGGSVYYRRKLALKWHAAPLGEVKFFDLKFGFHGVHFETFTLDFEGMEENVSKDGKSKNSVIFQQEEGALKVSVKPAIGDESAAVAVTNPAEIHLTIDQKDCSNGEFALYVNDALVGKLNNIGGFYLPYQSSTSTTPITPITFTMKGGEDATQKIVMKELNLQSLKVDDGGAAATDESGATVTDADGFIEWKDGKVTDNADAVLVVNEGVYAFRLGQKFSLSYEVIDVCYDSSISPSRYYYMAKKNADGAYVKPKTDYANTDDYKSLSTSTFFMPTEDTKDFDSEYEGVSIRFYLDDRRTIATDDRVNHYVYLNWYAAEGKDVTVTLGEGDNEFEYIKVIRDLKGPRYVEGADKTAATEAYQEAVDRAAENVSAGDGAYFYLPSLRGLITSDYADYRNLKFSVYYYKESQAAGATATSATSLSYNALRFEINQSGTYRFRVLAVDSAGNSMTGTIGTDTEPVAVTGSNIWEINEIPEFTFEARYTGAVIEEPGEQTDGYRDSSYSVSSFKVIALSGIEKDYKLYLLNDKALNESSTKSDLTKNIATYMTDETSPYYGKFLEIQEYNDDVKEGDDEWNNTHNKYHWNPSSSLSFVPQEDGFYVVELIVTDPNRSSETTNSYMVIRVNSPYDWTLGQSQWLQNNIVSIVLFSISAVLLVIIIILFVSKPSEKKVEEIDLEKLKGKRKSKK